MLDHHYTLSRISCCCPGQPAPRADVWAKKIIYCGAYCNLQCYFQEEIGQICNGEVGEVEDQGGALVVERVGTRDVMAEGAGRQSAGTPRYCPQQLRSHPCTKARTTAMGCQLCLVQDTWSTLNFYLNLHLCSFSIK